MPTPTVSAIVPTLGRSPWLDDCLEKLRRTGGDRLEIILVDQTSTGIDSATVQTTVDRHLRPGPGQPNASQAQAGPLGFAAANNWAIADASGDFIALVNDDATVDADWLPRLLRALDADAKLGAVQGTNLSMQSPDHVDGRGIAWNRWWQALQIDHGQIDDRPADREVFGVSATAAVFRRAALTSISGAEGTPFEGRLGSYYEDVDLAIRLRGAGWRAGTVSRAIAQHAGSTTGRTMPYGARVLIHGNRVLVLARLFGRRLWPRLPRILVRDLADLWQARRRGEMEAVRGVVRGLGRGFRLLPRFAHAGPARVPDATLRRFMPDRPR